MSILIKQATILNEFSKYHLAKKDILITNGRIEKIANKITSDKAKIIESENLHVSPGWTDIGSLSGEPGYEHRETMESLNDAAAAGGFTTVACFPNTDPVIDNKSGVHYFLNNSNENIVNIVPIGAISKACKGEEITEMMDMHHHGAVAFSDGIYSVRSSGLLLRALQYVKGIKGLIINQPDDPTLSYENTIHEGTTSTNLGLKGSPVIAETLSIERDVQLCNYAESKLLIHKVSSKSGVDKLTEQQSADINASVSFMNLIKTDESLISFDPNYKCNPPLRSEQDKNALIQAVNNGTVRVICSDHRPIEDDLKTKEFVYASPGMIGLQTCFSALMTWGNKLNLEKLIAALSVGPMQLLGFPVPEFIKDEEANITLFDPTKEWTYTLDNNKSKSKNSPFIGDKLKGQVIGVIKGKKSYFNAYDS